MPCIARIQNTGVLCFLAEIPSTVLGGHRCALCAILVAIFLFPKPMLRHRRCSVIPMPIYFCVTDSSLGYCKERALRHFKHHKTQYTFCNFGKQGYLLCIFLTFHQVFSRACLSLAISAFSFFNYFLFV